MKKDTSDIHKEAEENLIDAHHLRPTPRAEIITIGDEILIGQVVDTNSAWIGQELALAGWQVGRILSVGDEPGEILEALSLAMGRAQLVILTGGLGPTRDDRTKSCLTEFFGGRLTTNNEVLERIEKWFVERGRNPGEANRQQANLPDNAHILLNDLGTAQGMLWDHEDCMVVSLPGVPYEMKHLVSDRLMPLLGTKVEIPTLLHHTYVACGMEESMIAETIADWELALPDNIRLAYLPSPGMVRLRLSAMGRPVPELETQLQQLGDDLKSLLGHHICGNGDERLPDAVGKALLRLSATVGLAESCTGGEVSRLLTSVAGCSRYFQGGFVAYNNDVKCSLLGMQEEVLSVYGTVSAETVAAMALSARSQLRCDYSVSISGIAGPDGGSDDKPIGTIWIGVHGPHSAIQRHYRLGGTRELIQQRAAMTALFLLWKMLNEDSVRQGL
ncbi:MAG: CinA family nicotinamide mononucleotide deamidase-related protein [Sphingomonadales bacterium]|nr:CinA family nicotinamide mononucleotide deamidase-related protein [Sphingomonadales bacterium]